MIANYGITELFTPTNSFKSIHHLGMIRTNSKVNEAIIGIHNSDLSVFCAKASNFISTSLLYPSVNYVVKYAAPSTFR